MLLIYLNCFVLKFVFAHSRQTISVCTCSERNDNDVVKCLINKSMRFRISWLAFVTLAAVSFWALHVVFREDCTPLKLNARSDISLAVVSPDAAFSADVWVLNCITWDKQRQSSNPENVVVHDFGVNRTFAVGESADQRRLFFHRIFAARDWPADDPSYNGLKASGPGSMLRNAQNMIAVLHSVISHVKSSLGKSTVSVFDVACGDMQWMPYVLDSRSDIVYTGADIVPDIIAHHKKKLKRLRTAEFVVHDVVSVPLNRSYDIILLRDVLQHLWMVDAMMALKHLSESGSKFMLATTFHDTAVNVDVDKEALGGRKSSYNLERPPFSLESPVCSSFDWNMEYISLWNLPLKQISV